MKTADCVEYFSLKEMRSQFLIWNEMQCKFMFSDVMYIPVHVIKYLEYTDWSCVNG
jgi:hypothetical protein